MGQGSDAYADENWRGDIRSANLQKVLEYPERPEGKTSVTIKIVDVLGEEVLVTGRV
jgi:hypothetical protein